MGRSKTLKDPRHGMVFTRSELGDMFRLKNLSGHYRHLERAILALYDRQTTDEQQIEDVKTLNERGFSAFDVKSGSYWARWIQSGKHLSNSHVERAQKMVVKYLRQLNEIAKEKLEKEGDTVETYRQRKALPVYPERVPNPNYKPPMIKVLEVDQWTSTGDMKNQMFDDFDVSRVGGGSSDSSKQLGIASGHIMEVTKEATPMKGNVWYVRGSTGKCKFYKANYDSSD